MGAHAIKRLGDDPAGGPDRVDLSSCLYLDHARFVLLPAKAVTGPASRQAEA
jgi:hypothetical protein